MDDSKSVWSELLSQSKDNISDTFNSLSKIEQQYVINHLQKMVSEEGWHPKQIESAKYAMKIILEKGSE